MLEFQIKELCGIVARLSTHHRNLLYLVQIQPPSTYGIELQRCLSLTLVHWLVLKFWKQEQTGKRIVDDRCSVTVPDTIEVKWKLHFYIYSVHNVYVVG